MSVLLDFSTITAPMTNAERQRKWRASDHYVRHSSSKSGRNGAHHATLLEKPVCTIDGEGEGNNPQRYTTLKAWWPDGKHSIRANDLSTIECFNFLLGLPPGHVYVIYGGSYDMNMWVRDIPSTLITKLLNSPRGIQWKSYRLHWIERKLFTIRRGKSVITIYDVVANWQTKFTDACKKWGIGTLEEIAWVEFMKDHREELDRLSQAEVDRYCETEVEWLGALCRKLFDAIKATGYAPRAVYGPGALASAALEKHEVKRHYAPPPAVIADIPRHAYYGGRFDTAQLGIFDNVWQYDIKSAYPDQARNLPCLKHSTWRETGVGYVTRYGLYHVDWYVDTRAPWGPFPHRYNDLIHYHTSGSGWYHGDEVMAAIELFGAESIKVQFGWELVPGCSERPFAFVESLFDLRKSMPPDQGIVVKLIINSVYGKLAQTLGTRRLKDGTLKLPPFQNWYYAGAITSGTRAKILRGIKAFGLEHVFSIATDSLVTDIQAGDKLDMGGNLGQWDEKALYHFLILSNGIYHGTDTNGNEVERSRGLERTTLDWDKAERQFKRHHGITTIETETKSRFVTWRHAMHQPGLTPCSWVREPRQIRTNPKRKLAIEWRKPGRLILEGTDPESWGRSHESEPFRIKTGWNEANERYEEFHITPRYDYD